MRDLSTFGRIYLAVEPVDFRKQAHSLALIVDHALHFINKRKTAIKLLYWVEQVLLCGGKT